MDNRLLSPKARDLVLACCLYPHGRKCRVHAVVVMPEHVHLLLSPLRNTAGETFTFAEILHPIKSVSAHRINKLRSAEGPVWQDESFDHVVRSEEKLDDKIEYLTQNPVRRGLVSRPEQYRWLWVEPFDPREVPPLGKKKP
jgi:REP element-mobilizing transposase RayT